MFLIDALLIVIISGVISTVATSKTRCVESSPIVKIGACDYSGVCSAVLKDGKIIKALHPVEGKEVCLLEERKYWVEENKIHR